MSAAANISCDTAGSDFTEYLAKQGMFYLSIYFCY